MAQKKRLLYLSAGTVATGRRWQLKFGPEGRANGLAESTGKEFVQWLFRLVIEAFGDQDGWQLIFSTGGQEDALEGIQLPKNLVAQGSVPQLELLPKCHVFITHGGANSVHEALSFRVPMVVVPIFGDQPANAQLVADAQCGVAFCKPFATLTVPALRAAVEQLAEPQVLLALGKLSQELQKAGGVPRAIEVAFGSKSCKR